MAGAIGKDYESRQLSREVRDLALEEIRGILNGEINVEKRFRQAIILKLAGTVLPRLNEHTGEDGNPIPVSIYGGTSNKTVSGHIGDPKGIPTQEED